MIRMAQRTDAVGAGRLLMLGKANECLALIGPGNRKCAGGEYRQRH